MNCGFRLSALGFRKPDAEPEAEPEYSCTKRARFFTFSTGVSGRMPWPRLKMWPGRPAAWPQDVFRARLQFFPLGKQQYGIEISLHGAFVIEAATSLRPVECASRGR